MIGNETKEKSQRLRQFVIDLCSSKTATVANIATLYNISSKLVNHHLRALLEEGYIVKHKRYIKVNGAYANGYTTIKNEPYVWASRKTNILLNKPVVIIDYDEPLMRRLGYTNLIPAQGRVCLGIMSKD